jgi:hypothetical protein
MTISTSPLAYDDCYEVFERAIASDKGIRIPFTTSDETMNYVMRLHNARQLKRDLNTEVYPKDHPMYGKSDYDILKCSRRKVDGTYFVYVEKMTMPAKIEEL